MWRGITAYDGNAIFAIVEWIDGRTGALGNREKRCRLTSKVPVKILASVFALGFFPLSGTSS